MESEHEMLRDLFLHAEELMWAGDYSGSFTLLGETLDGIDETKMPELFLVAWLRITSPTALKCPAWRRFRDRVGVELEKQGKPTKRILRGLWDEDLEKSPHLKRPNYEWSTENT